MEPEAIEVLSTLVRQYEEPYADSSAPPDLLAFRNPTREHVTAALNGDGGDENFRRLRPVRIPETDGPARPPGPPASVAALIRPIRTRHRILGHVHRRLAARTNYRRAYAEYVCHFRNDDKARILTREFLAACPRDSYDLITDRFEEAGTRDRMDQVLYADFTTYLPDDLMVKVDIASMAVALEGRSPLLDHEFMELAAQIPSELKLKGASDKKYIFKRALEGVLPHEVLHRPKMGFGIPVDEWLRYDLKEFARDAILKDHPVKRGMFRMDRWKNCWTPTPGENPIMHTGSGTSWS
ncbi:MAG: asparagine synthase-related protein [Kiritimatiellia bacterium]